MRIIRAIHGELLLAKASLKENHEVKEKILRTDTQSSFDHHIDEARVG